MTHLHIAKNLYRLFPEKIKDLPQFYLGNVAPDAVHNRAGYIPDYKKASHLCVGDEPWGMLTNNEEWTENVLAFLDKNKDSDNYIFILGYCCHILADIYNNITVWTPFRLKYPDEIKKGLGGLYHQESGKVEIELALREENREDFWVYLEKASPVGLDNIIFEEEIEKHRENILNKWFKNKERPDISTNKLITVESTMKFVEDAVDFITCKLGSLISR